MRDRVRERRFAKISTTRKTPPSSSVPATIQNRGSTAGGRPASELLVVRGSRSSSAVTGPGYTAVPWLTPRGSRRSSSMLSRLWPDRNTSTLGRAAAIPRASGSYRGEPFKRVHPDDLVRQPVQPRHLRPQQLGVAALQPVGAQHDHRAAQRRPLAPPVEQRLQRLADPRPALPVGHLRPISCIARSGSCVRSSRVTRVRRVPKQKTSTRRPAAIAAYPNWISAREYGAIEPLTSRISTSGRPGCAARATPGRTAPPGSAASAAGSAGRRTGRPSAPAASGAPVRSGRDRERADQPPDALALVLVQSRERLRAQDLDRARDDPERRLVAGLRRLVARPRRRATRRPSRPPGPPAPPACSPQSIPRSAPATGGSAR